VTQSDPSTTDTGTTSGGGGGRQSVTSAADDPQASPTETPQEVQHTPTLPQGFISTNAEPVTNIPPGTPLQVADPAAGPAQDAARPSLEIAAPAPLPRPGDEQLTRGTVDGDAKIAELTGVAPELPSTEESAPA